MKNWAGNLENRPVRTESTVALTEDHIILCTLRGFIDETVAGACIAQTDMYAEQLRSEHRPVMLLIDANGVTGQNSRARSLAKKLGEKGYEKVAVCNRNVALGMIIRYLLRAANLSETARMFRTQEQARRWLIAGETDQTPYFGLRLGVTFAVVIIAAAALVGWGTNTEVLTSIVPDRQPMNPVVAVCLLLLAFSILLFKPPEMLSARRKAILASIAVLATSFGVSIMLEMALGRNLHVGDWLFRHSLYMWDFSGRAFGRTGFLLAALGAMELIVLAGQQRRWQRYAFHTVSISVFITALSTLINYGFRTTDLHNAPALLVAINTAICVLLINHALQTVCKPLPWFDRAWRVFSIYAQAIFVFMTVFIITGIAWQQARASEQAAVQTTAKQQFTAAQDLIKNRVNAYIDTLRGYRSFFESSDFVAAHEFETYFQSSRLTENYPGFSAILFAGNVTPPQKASYVAAVRQQASSTFPSLATFNPFPDTTSPVSYPVTYIEPHTAATTYGFDLSTDTERRVTLEKARDTDTVTATGTINLNASKLDKTLPVRPGFFITIPIYKGDQLPISSTPANEAQRRATIYGFVNAVFEDSKLFDDIFKTHKSSHVTISVQNARTGEQLYTTNAHPSAAQTTSYNGLLNVAGQSWRVHLQASGQLGLTRIETYLPHIILISGVLLAMLAAMLAASQSRRKEQALHLASDMTEDLNNERDAAVVLQKKDEAILSSIGDAVFALDPEGKIILFNQVAERLTGTTAQAAIGRPYTEVLSFYSEKDGSVADEFITTALKGKKTEMPSNTVLKQKDGNTIPVADSAAPIVNSTGELEGVVVVFRDVSRERELMKLKDDFVSIASHELRTPMGAVRAFVSMILAGDYGPVNKNLVEPLNDIKHSTMRLVTLVNDLLDAARIEAGRMKFTLADVDVAKATQEVADSLAPLGREKGVIVSAKGTSKPALAQADEDKLKQILTNLVGNALKFTDNGSITLTVAKQTNTIEISVTDTGMGISEDDRKILFGKFQQISSAQAGRPAGTGLGLYISREMIQKLGGDLWLKGSTAGKGSTFALTLPCSGTMEAKRAKETLDREAGMHPDQK